jgi:hypothetical protein
MTNDKSFLFFLPGEVLLKVKDKAWSLKISAAEFIRKAVEKELAQ